MNYYSETWMSIVKCDAASDSALGKALIERADSRDACRAPLLAPEASAIEIFLCDFCAAAC